MAPTDDTYKLPDDILDTFLKLQVVIHEFDPSAYPTLDAHRRFRYLLGHLATEVNISIIPWELRTISDQEDHTPESKLYRNVDDTIGIPESCGYPHPAVEEDAKGESPPGTAVTKMTPDEKKRAENIPSNTEEMEARIEEETQVDDSQETGDENENGFYPSEPSSAKTNFRD